MIPLKLVTFDVTGTLLFFRTPVVEKYVETGLKYGIKTDPEILGNNFKKAWKSLNEEHPNFGKQSGFGWEDWWMRFVQKTFNDYVQPGQENKITEILRDLNAFHTTKDAFTVRPGSRDFLEYLRKRSLTLGIISNYDPRLNEILECVDLKKYFDFVLISYEFGHPKPDGRIFREALKLAGCKSEDEALHVGDDLELDYLAARDAGWRALLITSDSPKDLNNRKLEKSHVFQDFIKMKTYFESLQ